MTLFLGLVILVLHAALMLAAAPLLVGVLGLCRARLAGRAGAPLLQPFHDLRRLARKQPVLPESASRLLVAAPIVALASLAVAALLIPSFALGMASAPAADLIVLAGLLTVSRGAIAMAGLESGISLGGIAASRGMSLAILTEPALLLVIFAMATMSGATNLDSLAGMARDSGSGLRVSLGLALAAAAIVAMVETGRFQGGSVLGMGQDSARLAFSGWHLAVADYAAALRLTVWLSLLLVMFVPVGIAPAGGGVVAWLIGLLVWAAKMMALTAGLALTEAGRPAMRWTRAPELVGMALLLGLLATVFLFIGQGAA